MTDSFKVSVSMPVFSIPILLTLSDILKASFHDRTYWCLLIGFSTCEFHMSIIETHLFSQYTSSKIPSNIASLTLTVYGIFTMLGAVITSFLGPKIRMKNVLTGVYGIRIFIALAFIFYQNQCRLPFSQPLYWE